MCTGCGCGPAPHEHGSDQDSKTIQIQRNILEKNDSLAQKNRALFGSKGIFTLNLVSSPGSGKTSILERTLTDLKDKIKFAVLEGDQQTNNDADRIEATGVPAKQINTGSGCHLDAHMVMHGVEHFDLDNTDVLMIENVGNLVCPASFDLGEDLKVAVLSVTEGEDKPIKYPEMFREAKLMLINKIDLLPHLDFDVKKCCDFAMQVNPGLVILEVSCKTGEGMDNWYAWLTKWTERKHAQKDFWQKFIADLENHCGSDVQVLPETSSLKG